MPGQLLEFGILRTKARIVGTTTLRERLLTVGDGQEPIGIVDRFQYAGIVFSFNPWKLFDHYLEASSRKQEAQYTRNLCLMSL